MSDQTSIADCIRTAVDTLEDAHHARRELREEIDHETLNAFHKKMGTPGDHP